MKNQLNEAKHPSTSHKRLRELAKNPALALVVLQNPSTPIELAAQLRKQLTGQENPEVLDEATLALLAKEANTQTDPERLAWLSQFGGDITRAVARNPSTPQDCLQRLIKSADVLVCCELLRNPALSGHDIEALPSHKKIIQRAIAACPRTPSALLVNWSTVKLDHKMQESLAQNPSMPLMGLIQFWLGRQACAVRLMEAAVAQRQDEAALQMRPWLGKLRGLARLPIWKFKFVQEALATGTCSERLRDALLQASTRSDFYVTEAQLQQIAEGELFIDWQQMTRSAIAERESLASMANSSNVVLRRSVAANYRVSEKTLQALATDAVPSVRAAVARNPRAPQELLVSMAKDEHPEVLSALLQNYRLPSAAIDGLLDKAEPSVRLSIAGSAQLSEAAMQRLCADEAVNVRKRLAERSVLPASAIRLLAADQAPSVRALVLTKPNVSGEVLAVLARDPEVQIRREVAKKRNADEDTLARLGKDRSKYVRLEVAHNAKARARTLERLLKDKEPEVTKAAEETLQRKARGKT